MDSFHTGFNLECLADYERFTGDTGFHDALERGLGYFLANFFTAAGEPKYEDTQTFPIDVHAPAQLVITLARLGRLREHQELVDRVLAWTIRHMQDPKGYFYEQAGRHLTCRTPFMRWAQAWMFYALALYEAKGCS